MNEAMEKKRPRKLNLNAPLLSTRRPGAGGHISDKVSCTNSMVGWKDSSNGIPFCWEQTPGKPKNLERNNIDEAETPRPKPPPGRWRPPKEATNGDHHDEGCDADVDDYDDDDDNDDVFSNAMEVLSLTEAIDIVEKAEKFHGSSDGLKSKSLEPSDLDGFNLEMSLEHSTDCPSPTFIIERFLPDATALAASSALNMSKTKLPYLCNYSDQSTYVSQAVMKRSTFSSPKHCGLEILLPWRMKHQPCGVKSPIKEIRSTNIVQPKTSTKQKKLFSSIVAPSGEWKCN
ncbi:hypothetical protein REPUB_Repub02eG0284200 [Reevesia pubescens]